MKEHPILFSAPMVKAILDGRKTQTRRVIKPQPYITVGTQPPDWPKKYPELCPYGVVGDRLWVRETWAQLKGSSIDDDGLWYRADGEFPSFIEDELCKWKPSIHMFRKYSRITLEITDIRVERVHDISAMDCISEGIPRSDRSDVADRVYEERNEFNMLWDSINGKKYPWVSNPWVWVVGFKRCR